MPRSPLRRRRSLPSVTWASLSAAVMSAVLVNPLDVAKTRLQAQAAGVVYNPIWSDFRCYPSCNPGGINGLRPSCSPECFQYRGTMDVFSKVTRQEGIFRLWRGTGASVALAVPMVGIYLPSYDLLRNWIEEYAPLISGSIARSLACIACSPIELARTRMQGNPLECGRLCLVCFHRDKASVALKLSGIPPPLDWSGSTTCT